MIKSEHIIDIGKIIRDKVNNQTYKISGYNHEEVQLEHITRFSNDKKEDKAISWERLLYLFKADELTIEGYEFQDYEKLTYVVDTIIAKEEAKHERSKLEKIHEEEINSNAHIIHKLATKSSKVEDIRMKRREKVNPEIKKKFKEHEELQTEIQDNKERDETIREQEYRELTEEMQKDKDRDDFEQLIELTKEQIAESNSSTEKEKLNERLELYQELLIENS